MDTSNKIIKTQLGSSAHDNVPAELQFILVKQYLYSIMKLLISIHQIDTGDFYLLPWSKSVVKWQQYKNDEVVIANVTVHKEEFKE